MKVLVTGGIGFIGSHTTVELLQAGHEVVIVDNLYNSSLESLDAIEQITGIRVPFYRVDILEKEKLEEVFQQHSFDTVIHFAGYKAVAESVEKPLVYYQNNISGSLNLYELMRKYRVYNLVFSSSATVYGSEFEVPFKEEYGTGTTTNPYGTTKLFNERILTDLSLAEKDFSVVLLRYFNPVGAHSSGLLGEDPNGIPNNLVPYIARVAIGEYPYLNVNGNDYDTPDGTGVRDYIHVVDLARAHVAAIGFVAENKGCEVINIGTGIGYSVFDVLHAYEKACGHEIAYRLAPRRRGDIASCFADPSKAERLLNFKTQFGIEQMCADSYNFMLKRIQKKGS